MAKKTCPECQAQHGPRTLRCGECGHQFRASTGTGKSKVEHHPLGHHEATPGLWVYDLPKGMPKVPVPPPLPPGPLDTDDIYEYVSYNGLGDCIFCDIPSRKVADPALRKKWEAAHKAMHEVWDFITKGR